MSLYSLNWSSFKLVVKVVVVVVVVVVDAVTGKIRI